MWRHRFSARTIRTCALVTSLVSGATLAGCRRPPPPPEQTDRAPVQAAKPSRVAVKVDRTLGSNLRMVDFSLVPRAINAWDDGWQLIASLEILQLPADTAAVWVRAYPVSGDGYLTLDREGGGNAAAPTARVGLITGERFVVPQAGAYNLYAGTTQPDGRPSEGVPLGWIAVGNPTSPAFLSAVKVLTSKGFVTRAAEMVDQAFIDHPAAEVPDEMRVALMLETQRFDAILPYFERQFASGWRPARLEDWLAITAVVQAAGWKDNGSSFDAAVKAAPKAFGAAAAMANAARLRARGERSTERPPFEVPFTPSVTVSDGLRAVGASIISGHDSGKYALLLFLQADKDLDDRGDFWLHVYPSASATAYLEAAAQAIAHPASLKRGDYTWRMFTFSRDGAFTVFAGTTREGKATSAASLGWVAFESPTSPQLITALETIAARGAQPRAVAIAEAALLANPDAPGLAQWLHRLGK